MAEREDDEATVIRARRPPGSSAGVDAGGEDAEATIIRLVEPHRPAPLRALREPGDPAPVTAPTASERWAVQLRGSAAVVPLDRPLTVGRRPGAARPGEHPEPRFLVIPPDRADVSGRHARLEQLGETLVVADLGSTNGTVVHWAFGVPRRLRPGESCAVLPDARIELGEGVVLEFVPAASSPALDPLTSEPPS